MLHRPGDEVTLTAGGKETKVKLGERTTERANVATAEALGLTCVELGAELRRYLGLDPDLRGVVVQAVKAGSAAAEAGIRPGDVITGAAAAPSRPRGAEGGARGREVRDRPAGRPPRIGRLVRHRPYSVTGRVAASRWGGTGCGGGVRISGPHPAGAALGPPSPSE